MVHNQLCVVGDPEVIRPAIAELMFAYLARSKALSLGFPLNEARSKSLTEVFGWMWLLPLSAGAVRHALSNPVVSSKILTFRPLTRFSASNPRTPPRSGVFTDLLSMMTIV